MSGPPVIHSDLVLTGSRWRAQAACAGDDFLFFSDNKDDKERARAYCRMCLVQAECLDEAMRNDERYGIWGGLDPDERRIAKRQKQRLRPCGTTAAYRRHRAAGEEPCDDCKAAKAEESAAFRRKKASA